MIRWSKLIQVYGIVKRREKCWNHLNFCCSVKHRIGHFFRWIKIYIKISTEIDPSFLELFQLRRFLAIFRCHNSSFQLEYLRTQRLFWLNLSTYLIRFRLTWLFGYDSLSSLNLEFSLFSAEQRVFHPSFIANARMFLQMLFMNGKLRQLCWKCSI